jgi:hypothetical protein
MKKAELIFTILLVFAFFMSLMMVPGGAIFSISILTWLSFIYFYGGYALFNNVPLLKMTKSETHKDISSIQTISSIVTGGALGIVLMGILFKMEQWPGAAIMLLFGLTALFVAGVVSTIQYVTTKGPFYFQLLKRIVPYFIAGIILYFFSHQIFVEFKYRDYPAYVAAVNAWKADPSNDTLREKMHDERVNIDRRKYEREFEERE